MAKAMVLTKENVLATMAGRKRMTRRIINPQPDNHCRINFENGILKQSSKISGCWHVDRKWKPRYQVGDEVYVAEGYQIIEHAQTDMGKWISGTYTADKKIFQKTLTTHEEILYRKRQYPGRPTSGRFFYKSLARTFMKIVEVRVERLWDISESDCIAEGVIPKDLLPCSPYEIFATLWKTIHGPGAWKLNPWVWVYSWKLGDK